MSWLAYLLAMGSHFALHCYHAMMRRVDKAINSLLRKFYVNVNYIPTCIRRQLFRCDNLLYTMLSDPFFVCVLGGWVTRLPEIYIPACQRGGFNSLVGSLRTCS